MPIRPLPTLLVNQIAAGEVIERPASVVKELVENAIDAHASRIDITIENGGRDLIRVADNGCGIAEDELPLALAPHATSKIETSDDLAAIATMGFRGEALASIASVSRMSIVSRPADAVGAARVESEGNELTGPQPCSGPVGTTVTVRNLFFNTPARRKFLRTDQTEAGRVSDIVHSLALAHPAVGWTLTVNTRTSIDLPPGQSPRHRALAILGSELEEQLLELEFEDRGLSFWGLVGTPQIARGTAKHIRTFLNGRPINDRTVNHAVREAYRGLLDPSRFPTVVLFIVIDPSLVDVNVHPAKAEVRFRQQAQVHGAVMSAVRQRLRDADLAPSVQFPGGHGGAGSGSGIELQAVPPRSAPEFGSGRSSGDGGHEVHVLDRREPDGRRFIDDFHRLDAQQKSFVYAEMKETLSREMPEMFGRDRDEDPGERDGARAASDGDEMRTDSARGSTDDDLLMQIHTVADVLQVHSSYLVTQDDQGLLIIDQHALHERVMFERLKQQVTRGNLESQRLLMPITINVEADQIELIDDLKPLLERIGIEAEPIGRKAIAVHSFTSMLFDRGADPAEFMADLLRRAAEEGLPNEPEAALHETLDMMACKAAVKAGDALRPEELTELLRQRDRIERSSNCPHGRPTTLRLTLRDLEKQFGRR